MLVYKDFLERFPGDKESYEMAFYYGEILWTVAELGKGSWKDAAEQYTKVVEINPKGKYVKGIFLSSSMGPGIQLDATVAEAAGKV